MDDVDIRKEIKRLGLAERILLAEEIWDSVAERQGEVVVTQAQKEELDRRLDSYKKSPKKGSSWQEVKSRIQKKK